MNQFEAPPAYTKVSSYENSQNSLTGQFPT